MRAASACDHSAVPEELMIHTPSHCPKCGKTFFEVTELMNLEHARYDVDAIRCKSCQSVVGVLPSGHLTWLQEFLEQTIKKLGLGSS
jgi:hypothetical protein